MTDYIELAEQMREASDFPPTTAAGSTVTRAGRNRLLRAGADAITSLVQRNTQPEPAAEQPVRDMDSAILRREAADLALREGEAFPNRGPIERAGKWLAYLEDGTLTEPRKAGDWAPTQQAVHTERHREFLERAVGEALGAASVAWTGGTRGVFESAYVSGIVDTLMAAIDRYADEAKQWGRDQAVSIHKPRAEAWDALWQIVGGGELTDLASAQQRIIDRMRDGEPKPPAHGLAVGDVLTVEQMASTPTGLVVVDKDGDRWERTDDADHDDPEEVWQSSTRDGALGAHYSLREIAMWHPFTVHTLPEPTEAPDPEDTTPRVGDTVRVESSVHRVCRGMTGTLEAREGAQNSDTAYEVRDAEHGKHIGPLSDFVLVKRAGA